MATPIPTERQRAHELAQEYRARGYEVTEAPQREQLPEFLSMFRPDLLVKKDNEAIIVEVKARSTLAKDPQVREMARALQDKPGWRLEMVLVHEEERLEVPEGAEPLAREEVLQRATDARQLLESEAVNAALIAAWSALEAAVRLLVEEEDIRLGYVPSQFVLKHAVTKGVIAREEYNFLMEAIRYRNQFVHGFKATNVDPALVSRLVSTAEHLLQAA